MNRSKQKIGLLLSAFCYGRFIFVHKCKAQSRPDAAGQTLLTVFAEIFRWQKNDHSSLFYRHAR